MIAENGSDWRAGHRRRLREKFSDGKTTDAELLELLLCYAIPRLDVRPVARELTNRFGDVHNIISSDAKELCKIKGIGESAATLIALIRRLMLQTHRGYMKDAPLFHNANRINDYCRLLLAKVRVEEFHILYLDGTRRLISDDTHSAGTTTHVAAYPREILKRALELNARHVVLVHNHPDGSGSFSTADMELTQKIREKLAVDGIEVIDHLLVSDNIVFSARNMLLLN